MEPNRETQMMGVYMLPPDLGDHLDNTISRDQTASLDKLLHIQKVEIEHMDSQDFKVHQLPLARVKKIMKSDEDVRMISAESPAVFAKACEFFIIELTHRSWAYTEEAKRRTLQRNDIEACINKTDIFDFLQDLSG
ncbi:unnamed protein product [Blepharisma stoltei]|uniref:Core Histone H2A/H2B/H3 domain-containing protein n=1 Tax=Blepharisma stoltei TaxID=1481888 RepID=A0AAU9JRI2_9CILI|nr:unnamed protein product [Blepharisma stoltei]